VLIRLAKSPKDAGRPKKKVTPGDKKLGRGGEGTQRENDSSFHSFVGGQMLKISPHPTTRKGRAIVQGGGGSLEGGRRARHLGTKPPSQRVAVT